jgi:hypothetical protein
MKHARATPSRESSTTHKRQLRGCSRSILVYVSPTFVTCRAHIGGLKIARDMKRACEKPAFPNDRPLPRRDPCRRHSGLLALMDADEETVPPSAFI